MARLTGFADLFTRPTWPHVVVLLAGAILAPGRRTVAAALRILGRDRDSNFCTFHRVLNRAAWSSRAVARHLLQMLVNAFLPSDAPIVIGLDDTIERRWGSKIKARGIYRDPVRSSKGHFVKASGLRWLSAMLLVRHISRRTAAMASLKVRTDFGYQAAVRGLRRRDLARSCAQRVTIEKSASRAGVVRKMALSVH